VNTYLPFDKDLLISDELLSDINKGLYLFGSLSNIKINLSYIITITLHFPDANTSLFQDKKEKEMNP
jgi:hypothetical protein